MTIRLVPDSCIAGFHEQHAQALSTAGPGNMGTAALARWTAQLRRSLLIRTSSIGHLQISLQAGPSHDPNSFVVRAGLARLQKQWGVAEALLLAQGKVEEAIRMYIEAHKWQEAIK